MSTQTKCIPDPFAFVPSSLEAALAMSIITSFQAYLLHPLSTLALLPLTVPSQSTPQIVFSAAVLIVLPPQLGPHCWLVALNPYLFEFPKPLLWLTILSLLSFSVDSAPCDRVSQLPFYSSHNLLLPPSLAFFFCTTKYVDTTVIPTYLVVKVPVVNPPTSSKRIPSHEHPSR